MPTAKPPIVSARILAFTYCAACQWPIILVACNDNMARTAPYTGNDWWIYCSNKACTHHAGVDLYNTLPEWVERCPPGELSALQYVALPYPKSV